jgi:hypothetical protein
MEQNFQFVFSFSHVGAEEITLVASIADILVYDSLSILHASEVPTFADNQSADIG